MYAYEKMYLIRNATESIDKQNLTLYTLFKCYITCKRIIANCTLRKKLIQFKSILRAITNISN